MKDDMNNQQIEALLAVRRFVEGNTVSADNGYAAGVDAANRNVVTHINWLLEQVRTGHQIPCSIEHKSVWPFEGRVVSAPQPLPDDVHKLIASMVSELRQHRWCGDCYPENGWPEINKVLSEYARFKRRTARRKKQAAFTDAAGSLNSVLQRTER